MRVFLMLQGEYQSPPFTVMKLKSREVQHVFKAVQLESWDLKLGLWMFKIC